MAVRFFTDDAKALLANFNVRIEQKEEKGKITTWERSADKKYYTHKAADWNRKAWFKPVTYSDRLTFNIIRPEDKNVSSIAYAYYHGHLIETFLAHFDQLFTSGVATALPTSDDRCSA